MESCQPIERLKDDDDDDDDDNNSNNKYVKRHDKVSAQIHYNICKETGVQLDKTHWYEHVPKSVVTNPGGKVTVLWNQQVQTEELSPITSQTL